MTTHERRMIRFVRSASTPPTGNSQRWIFADPAPTYAVVLADGSSITASDQDEIFEIRILNESTTREAEVLWNARSATLRCRGESAEPLISTIVQFTHYEWELRLLEMEIAAAWSELDEDRPLAARVGSKELKRIEVVGKRTVQTLGRRVRLARVEPHLLGSAPEKTDEARKLWKELRRSVGASARLGAVDTHLEAFEHVYEMASQRLGEYEAAHETYILEVVIIVLLAAEAILMAISALAPHGGLH